MRNLWRKNDAVYAARPERGRFPFGLLVPVLALAFVAPTVVGVTSLLQQAGLVDAAENPVGLEGFTAFLVLPFGALGLVLLIWTKFAERAPLSTIGLVADKATPRFLRGEGTGVLMALAIAVGIWLAGAFAFGGLARAFASPSALGAIAVLFLGFALQGSVEEILFRGWMLSRLAAKFGVFAGVVVSSAAFTLFHFDPGTSPVFVLNVFLFAVFACCWSLKAGSVWSVMGWHAGWNWAFATGFELRVTALDAHLPALLARFVPDGPPWLTGGVEGPEGSCVCTLVLACAAAFAIWRLARRPKPGA